MSKKLSVFCLALALAGVLGTAGTNSAVGQPLVASVAPRGSELPALTFVVRGLRSDNGRVIGGLYSSANGWGEEGRAVASCRATITHGVARCVMHIRPGTYAFAFAHDEDGNGRCNRDLIGIPQEGFGFSNNVRPNLAIPSFESASVQVVEGGENRQVVQVRYGI